MLNDCDLNDPGYSKEDELEMEVASTSNGTITRPSTSTSNPQATANSSMRVVKRIPIKSRIKTPYQNQPVGVANLPNKKRYTINTPLPGVKPKEFPGIDELREMKKRVITDRKISIVPTVPESLSCETFLLTQPLRNAPRTRYVLRIPKRVPIGSLPSPPLIPPPAPNETIHWNVPTQLEVHCIHRDCFWKGNSEDEFNAHLHKRHPHDFRVKKSLPTKRSSGVRCSECDAIVYSRALLLKHMGTAHGIALPSFSRVFQTEEELQVWLSNVRDAFCVDFVTGSGPKQWSSGAKISYLVCSRSGDIKERRTKKFCRPTRATIKCGKTCTAYLKMRKGEGEDETAPFAVEGCLYHTGHTISPSKINLTGEEIEAISAVFEKFGENAADYPIDEIRELLGPNAPRFRLIEDQELIEALPKWIYLANEWKYKGGRTEADQLADTIVFAMGPSRNPMNVLSSQHNEHVSFNRPPPTYRQDQYNYELIEDEGINGILYEPDLSAESEHDSMINVTDDFVL